MQLIKGHIAKCYMYDRCMYFDYGFSDDEPNKVFLYETYEVRNAFVHRIFPCLSLVSLKFNVCIYNKKLSQFQNKNNVFVW